jgi:predicted Rossmann-fold nucleotide-binding protein
MEIMMRRAGGHVFLPGGTGTLAELGVVWEHVAKGYVSSRPIVMVGEAWQPVVAVADERAASACLRWANDADEVARIMIAEAVELPPVERDYTAGLEVRSANI